MGVARRRAEWRVTGQPAGDYPPVSVVFGGPSDMDRDGTAEQRARAFIAKHTGPGFEWVDGPHLARRIVVESEWEPVDLPRGPGRRAVDGCHG